MANTTVTFLRASDDALTAKLTSVGGAGTPDEDGYACTDTNGLQSITISEALVGEFYLRAEDESEEIAYQGYVILADDTGTYRCHDEIESGVQAIRKLAEADAIIEEEGGVQVINLYERGTSTKLVPTKSAKQPGGAALTNPVTQQLAGYRE